LTTLALGSLVAGNRIVSAEHEPTAMVEAGALRAGDAGKAALTGCEVVPEFLPLEQCYPEPKNPLEHLTPTSSTTSTTSTTRPRPTTTVAPRVVQQRASRSAAAPRVIPPTTNAAPAPPPDNSNIPAGCMTNATKSIPEAHRCWDGLIANYSWPHNEAFAVMYCESRGNSYADNPRSSATGLFQILHGPVDPTANVATAYNMHSSRGWQPWETCPWQQYL
jgi:hypothetical protein